MSFFKLLMIVLVKIYTAVKVLGKICLKTIRDTFLLTCGLRLGEGKRTGGDIQQKGKVQTFSLVGGPPPPFSLLSIISP